MKQFFSNSLIEYSFRDKKSRVFEQHIYIWEDIQSRIFSFQRELNGKPFYQHSFMISAVYQPLVADQIDCVAG